MRRRRQGARWSATAAIIVVALTLTGCAGARSDFSWEFRGNPAIAEVEVTTGDNMPFTDGVRATVTLAHELDDERTTELLARLGAFIRDHEDEPVTVSVRTDSVSIPVFGDDAVTTAAVSAALDIASNAAVEHVALFGSSQEPHVTGVGLQVEPDVGTAFALARSAPERLTSIAAAGSALISVRDAGSAIRLEGALGPWLDQAQSTWALVHPSFPITRVDADADGIRLVLANEADVAGAEALTGAVEPPSTTPVAFGSPLVQLGLNGTGDEVRAMLAQLDASALSLIRLVWTTDTRAEFFVAQEADIAVVESALARLPDGARGALSVSVSVQQS